MTIISPSSPKFIDPLQFAAKCWPDLTFYKQQIEIIYSVIENDETVVPAGNALGKDFVAGFIALWWICSRRPARVVTTSVKMDQLDDVLWGEIRRFINLSKHQLPIQYNHLKIRQLDEKGNLCPNSELVGQVSSSKEGLLGRHSTGGFKAIQHDIPRTLVLFDEASGIDNDTYKSTLTWSHRRLIIGNPFPCENFFKRAVKGGQQDGEFMPGGDIPRAPGRTPEGKEEHRGYHRKIIRIRAEDSPNVILGQLQRARGETPTNEILVPGVKSYEKYCQDRLLWDAELQCVGLDADFYEGAEIRLFPKQYLEASKAYHDEITSSPDRYRRTHGRAIGVDPAQGGDKTCICVIDEFGVLDLVSLPTPDTSKIPGMIIERINRWAVPHNRVVLDMGGGGKQHGDYLRARGYNVRMVGFGESSSLPPRKGATSFDLRIDESEHRYTYVNRRAQMYGELSLLMDPHNVNREALFKQAAYATIPRMFAIPAAMTEVYRQLTPVPRSYDSEQRLKLPPKNSRPNASNKEPSLTDILGCSPDETDALVLAVHGMLHKGNKNLAGVLGK